jgi:hypothetical protein
MSAMIECTLTFASLLHDPLVQLVMRSDNVSEQEYSDLLFRVKGSLEMREQMEVPVFERIH